jgi:two-component system sensor histidine kinase and response regulator WspE
MNEAESDPLLDLFRAELREQAAMFDRGLLELARSPNEPAPLADLVQAAHKVRGAARILGYDAAAKIAAGLEGRFAAAQSAASLDLALCRRAVDALLLLSDYDPTTWAAGNAAELTEVAAALTGETPRHVAPQPPVAPPAAFVPLADPSMLELFREEVRSHAATLTTGLLDLERDPTNPQRIEPLMRAAHSLKGAARIVGLDLAVRLAHELEDAFVAAQAGRIRIGPPEIDVFLRGADQMAALGEGDLARWAATRHDDVARLTTAVEAVARGQGAPAVSRPQSAPLAAAQPVETPAAALPPPTPTDPEPSAPPESVVRVTAQSLNRLMSLAGESLVLARWLQPFAMSLLQLKKHQDLLAARLDGSVAGPAALDEARRQATLCRQVLAERIGEFEAHAGAAEDLNSRLYSEVIVSRMRPFADGIHAFPRLVRDTARSLGKSARLDVVGLATEVDRDILEKLEAPLTHLLRNAVDHGQEPTEARVAAGKPAEGAIRIEARHRAGMLAIAVGDDGAGIDIEKIRRKVVERRHATAEMAARMADAEVLEFLFLPGFSTAGQVTEVSGRGVGLDVVLDTVRKVGGSVHVTTRLGEGTTFHLLLPITLSVVRAVLVEIAGEPYAFPHNRIDRLLRVPRGEVRSLEHRQFIAVDGRNVGLVLAAQLLDLPAESPAGDDLPVLLLSDATGTYGLIVGAFLGEQDLVVRPLDPRLGKVPNVSAAAILDDGAPVLIADVEDLIRSTDQYIQSGSLRRCDRAATGRAARKRVLVVDDSITVREVQRQILRTHGYDVEVAVDGQDGWNKVRAERFDLVISDIDMPRMNGLEFVRRIRDDHGMKDLPVVIVSYKDRDEDRLRGLEVGANSYLTKSSFHDHTFLDAVESLIGKA